jgi:hypothetical protein
MFQLYFFSGTIHNTYGLIKLHKLVMTPIYRVTTWISSATWGKQLFGTVEVTPIFAMSRVKMRLVKMSEWRNNKIGH